MGALSDLSLTLLVLRVAADDPDDTTALDDAARLTDRLHGGSDLHDFFSTEPLWLIH